MPTTLSDETTAAAVAPYIEAVRVRIARLPSERRAELLEDLTHHLDELAAEPDADLREHLGEPEAFAEEYLTSAGVDLPQRRSVGDLRTAVRDRLTGMADHRWSVAVLDFLPELRPAWWVARGYVPAAAVLSGYGMRPFPFPDHNDEGVLPRSVGTVLALGAAAVSVWLGRQALAGRRVRWNRWATIAGVVAVLLATASLNRTGVADAGESYGGAAQDYTSPSGIGSVYSAEGNLITNFWIFDAQGNPLRDVYVFDQNGLPVSTPVRDIGPTTRIPVAPDGTPIVNRYPQDEVNVACPAPEGRQFIPVQPPTVVIPGLGQPVTPPPVSPLPAAPPTSATDPSAAPESATPSSTPAPSTAPSTTLVPPNSGLPC